MRRGIVFAILGLAACFSFPGAGRAGTIEVPLISEHGVLYVRAYLNGVGPMLFVVDPGARSFVTTYAHERLNGRAATDLTIGPARFHEAMPVLPGDPGSVVPSHDPRLGVVAGSVGPEILARYSVGIDYRRQTLSLTPFAQALTPRNAVTLALSIDEFGMPVIPASADGHAGNFELDVRAPTSMLFKAFAERSGLSARYAGAPVLKTGENRVQHELARVALGPYVVQNIATWFSSETQGKFASQVSAGLLGNNVLSHFIVTMNYRRREVYIQLAGPRAS